MKKYKFKDLKVYSSPEWMANSSKKYRTVFERQETTWLYFEFSFYNKLFDEQEWDADIVVKCLDMWGGKRVELCSLPFKLKVKTDENIVYLRDGWGRAKAGDYWYKGQYAWEVYIDNELVSTKLFYVNDIGLVTSTTNPYFTVKSINLYEGDGNELSNRNKKYIKKISRKEGRYLWIDFQFQNKTSEPWNYEFMFNFYDDAGQFKGQSIRTAMVGDKTQGYVYNIQAGWGNDIPGTWSDDKYIIKVVFMDVLIATIPFETAERNEEGNILPFTEEYISEEHIMAPIQQTNNASTIEDLTLEQHLEKLDKLIGLEDIKREIREHIQFLDYVKLRKEKGIDDNSKINLHSVFTGNPGTGKTTIVKMLGKIYLKMGLLSKGHVHEVDRADIVGEYIGQTAPKVRKAIDAARGGILFIDEAYSLHVPQSPADFGREVIEILLKEMSDGKGDLAVMVAGYPEEMKAFLSSNPGLKSRFGNYFHFADYTPEELFQILSFAAENQKVVLSDAAKNYSNESLIELYRNRDKTFGNARLAHSIVSEAKMNAGVRIMKLPNLKELSKEQLSAVELDDIKKVFAVSKGKRVEFSIDEKMLKESVAELDSLIGLSIIKEEMKELIKLVRYYNEIGRTVTNKFSLHSVFMGNPGTGKTTVARIVGKIYKALGLLDRGHVVECDREAMVAAYLGQTAIKTATLVDKAEGGVLFIDEAYALARHGTGGDDFGKEAIEVLLKRMEDKRGNFAVIAAGYTANMCEFIESNPGLKSRFDKNFFFPDYSVEELMSIAVSIFKTENLILNNAALIVMKEKLNVLYESRDKHFGNARTVRQIASEIIKEQHLRMASLSASERTKEVVEVITEEDLKDVKIAEIRPSASRLGFKVSV